jgi:DUF1680 family protein
MYFSALGKPEDLVQVERYFVQDWFLEASARREARSLSHYPYHVAHCYVLLAYQAWLDHYRATGHEKYLAGALGAWDIVRDGYLHVGGSLAICEHLAGSYPPGSYYLRVNKEHHTGENCGSVFWADINHRLLQLFPAEAQYADELEREIFNCTLHTQDERGYISYHCRLEGERQPSKSINTCCEVMGSPFIARLPQFLYSLADDGIYVNLYAPSTIAWEQAGTALRLRQETGFPTDGAVGLRVEAPVPTAFTLRIRVPGWLDDAVAVAINGDLAATGAPGTYVELDRTWVDGDAVGFALPLALHTVRYPGVDQHPEHPRHALFRGPILMALTGTDDLDLPAAELPERLRPLPDAPDRFRVDGVPDAGFLPYWQLPDGVGFTCFPTMR